MTSARAARAGWLHPIVWLILLYYSLVQRPGETTFDTKLDLVVDPAGFLARSAHLWNPQASFGEIQNQAYGYLFPQGPFFVLGELAHVAPWVVQRLWSAILLVAAYEGARRLWRALTDDDSATVGFTVGLAYAFGPRFLGLDGALTGEVLPTAVLPWMVLPLVHGRRGRLSPMTAGLLSGAALLFCGGLNAVENLAVLPLPFLLLVGGLREPDGWRRLGWWAGGTALASLWWMLPLFVMGAYSPNFLDYIENSSATTGVLGWFNVLRGANHWVGYLASGDTAIWPASFALSVTQLGVVVTALAVIPMIWGLFHRSMPWRGVWVGSFLLGAVCLVVANKSPIGSPLASQMRELLDGPLAPFRNVHKVDPLMRLPLALGAAAFMRMVLQDLPHPGWRRGRALVASTLTIGVVLVSGFPLFQGDMRRPGWREIPQAWHDTAAYVDEHHDGGRVLVLPGSGFANQTWGATVDEPLQALSSAPWVSRSQVPLAPGPTIRMLDAIEDRISQGIGSPALGAMLARSGVTLVVVRRDLDASATDAPPPNRVDMALGSSDGLTQVAAFGRTDVGGLPLIEVHRVDGSAPLLDVSAKSQLPVVSGDTGDVLSALEAGLIPEKSPTLFRKDVPGTSPDLQGDGLRLVQRQFALVHDATGGIMTPEDPLRGGSVARDYDGVDGELPTFRDAGQVAAMSSSPEAGFADEVDSLVALGPYAALDDDPNTAWISSRFDDPEGAWLELEMARPKNIGLVTVRFATTSGFARVRRVGLATDTDSVEVEVDPRTGVAVARLDGSLTRSLRLTVDRAFADRGDLVGVRELRARSLRATQRIVVPDQGADTQTSFVFGSRTPRGACTPTLGGPVCDASLIRGGAPGVITREFTVDGTGEFDIRGQVVAQPLPGTAELTHPLSSEAVTVRSDSVFAQDPLVLPQFSYDGDLATAWFSAPDDDAPTLSLRWEGKRRLDRISVVPPSNALAPTELTLRAGDEVREVSLGGLLSDGSFEPLRTDRLEITLSRPGLDRGDRPMGVAEMRIRGLDDKRPAFDPSLLTGAICGLGPEVRVDGELVPTKVTGTLGQLVAGAPLSFEACESPVRLTSGTQDLTVTATGQFQPINVRVVSSIRRARGTPDRRSSEVERWDSTHRRVRVGPGTESVLRIPENENRGWVATMGGKTLETVTPDGWQQGFVVPAGEGGVVTLRFTADPWYRGALLLGLLGALAVALAAAFSLLRDRRRGSWPVGPERVIPAEPGADVVPRRLGRLAVAALAGLVGGLGPALGVLAAPLVRRFSSAVVGLVVGAAVLLAVADLPDWVPGWSPDLLAGTAVGLMVGGMLQRRRKVASHA